MNDSQPLSYLNKIVRSNVSLFPYIWVTSIVLIVIESVTYDGFIQKYLLLDIKLLIALLVVSGFLARSTSFTVPALLTPEVKNRYMLLGEFNKLLLPSMIVVSYLLFIFRQTGSDSILFTNTNRIYPETFVYIPFLSLFLIYLNVSQFGRMNRSDLNDMLMTSPKQFLSVILIPIIILWIILGNALGSWKYFFPQLKTIARHPFASYDWKMTDQVGPVFGYYQFVNQNTPENAVIFHPKLQGRWGDVSNQGFTRYFVYPRNLIAEDEVAGKKETITHVFLIGNKTLFGGKQDSWPDFKVPATKIVYYSPDNSTPITFYGDYEPNLTEYPGYWGIIEVKKGSPW